MTVQELINALEKLKNKDAIVYEGVDGGEITEVDYDEEDDEVTLS